MVDGNVGVMVLKMLSALFSALHFAHCVPRGVWFLFRVVLTTFTGTRACWQGTSQEWRGAAARPRRRRGVGWGAVAPPAGGVKSSRGQEP